MTLKDNLEKILKVTSEYNPRIIAVSKYYDIDKIQEAMTEDDLLVISADHGCDPTVPGTDHTREQIPLLIWSKNIKPENLGTRVGFNYIAERVRDWLFN